MWDMLQTTSSHGWAVGDKTNSMRFATSLEEVRGLGTGRPARHGGGQRRRGPPQARGAPGGAAASPWGCRGRGGGPAGQSVRGGRVPHKASRVGELRESDEGSLLLLPFRCAAAQLGKASASG